MADVDVPLHIQIYHEIYNFEKKNEKYGIQTKMTEVGDVEINELKFRIKNLYKIFTDAFNKQLNEYINMYKDSHDKFEFSYVKTFIACVLTVIFDPFLSDTSNNPYNKFSTFTSDPGNVLYNVKPYVTLPAYSIILDKVSKNADDISYDQIKQIIKNDDKYHFYEKSIMNSNFEQIITTYFNKIDDVYNIITHYKKFVTNVDINKIESYNNITDIQVEIIRVLVITFIVK